jgi:hypothetical protein
MRRILKPLLVFAAIISWASWHTHQVRSADSQPKFPVEIPMQTDGGMPTVEVMVNGQGPFVFGFDTGAQGGPRIDTSLAEKLALKATGEVQAMDPSRQNPQSSATYKLDSISIGNLRLAGVTVAGRNYKNSPRPLKVDGILGLNALSEYLVPSIFPRRSSGSTKASCPSLTGTRCSTTKTSWVLLRSS